MAPYEIAGTGLLWFMIIMFVVFLWSEIEYDSAWARDRDACLRAGGVPTRMHLPDGRMAACAQQVEY